jgi:hypothetical protein
MRLALLSLIISQSFVISISAQIGGITGSKINSVNFEPIPVGLAEFEPTYNLTIADQRWDDNGDIQSLYSTSDSLLIDGSLNLRMAYTFTDRLEVGCNLGVDYSNFSFKYAIWSNEKLGLGIMGGTNHPFGFAEIDRTNRSADQISTYGLGGIASYNLSDKSSLDINIQFQEYFRAHLDNPTTDYFVSIDYGHYVKSVFLLGSFLYQESSLIDGSQRKLTFSPGISIEMKPEYLIVFNLNFDLFGKAIEKTSGLGLSFTMTL